MGQTDRPQTGGRAGHVLWRITTAAHKFIFNLLL